MQRELRRSEPAATITRVDRLDDFALAAQSASFDVILADYRLAGFTALDAWQQMNDRQIRLPFILLSGAIGESAAVQAIQAGISDYLPKSELRKLRRVIQRACDLHAALMAKEAADAELAQSQQRLAQFADHLQTTIEQERSAIAREIHDDIGGALAAIRFDLSWLERHTQQSASLAHVRAATDMLQHAVEASQRIMMNLRPAILDHGLAAAVQWLANNFSKRTGIATHVNSQLAAEKLPARIELTVFRTAQESLTNISKHAHCGRVKIDLTADVRYLTLEVCDDGIGFSSNVAPTSGGYGLKGLRERARTVGGWIDVSSAPGTGTTLTLTIALPEAPAPTGDATP